jgi:hypothetical protein
MIYKKPEVLAESRPDSKAQPYEYLCRHIDSGRPNLCAKGHAGSLDRESPCRARNAGATTCPDREWWSQEERDAYRRAEERVKLIVEAMQRIKSLNPARDSKGTIECPRCGGVLDYVVSATNGHIWGRCRAEKCLAWIE